MDGKELELAPSLVLNVARACSFHYLKLDAKNNQKRSEITKVE